LILSATFRHNRLCGRRITGVHDRIQALVTQGEVLDQVRATQPTLDYDTCDGAASGRASPDAFVAAVYESLRAEAGATKASK